MCSVVIFDTHVRASKNTVFYIEIETKILNTKKILIVETQVIAANYSDLAMKK